MYKYGDPVNTGWWHEHVIVGILSVGTVFLTGAILIIGQAFAGTGC
jgi:hypothetical protein